jgi:hypothetical protein
MDTNQNTPYYSDPTIPTGAQYSAAAAVARRAARRAAHVTRGDADLLDGRGDARATARHAAATVDASLLAALAMDAWQAADADAQTAAVRAVFASAAAGAALTRTVTRRAGRHVDDADVTDAIAMLWQRYDGARLLVRAPGRPVRAPLAWAARVARRLADRRGRAARMVSLDAIQDAIAKDLSNPADVDALLDALRKRSAALARAVEKRLAVGARGRRARPTDPEGRARIARDTTALSPAERSALARHADAVRSFCAKVCAGC